MILPKKLLAKKDKQLIENQGISVPHDQSPEEMLEDAVMQLNANLSDDLLSEIIKISPYDFEEIVVKLLIKMGYGKPEKNKDAVTQKSGDEGIDGIVSADKFGFDSIYIQAKQLSHLSCGFRGFSSFPQSVFSSSVTARIIIGLFLFVVKTTPFSKAP